MRKKITRIGGYGMTVPFVDLPRQIRVFEPAVRDVFEEVVFDRADFIARQDLLDFEAAFAEFTGTQHAIGVANGSDALNICIKVLEIGPGDEVITVAHTFVATVAAIVHAGATPVLVDVADDYNIDPDMVEAAITNRTKAIIPVHLNGRACQMDSLMDIANRHDLHVIEDSAQGIGATYDERSAGSFGILSTNSFYPFKIMGCFGDGGMITTNDDNLNVRLRCLRDNGQDRATGEILFWGWNSRLDNLQAAILTGMLEQLPQTIKHRRRIAARYHTGLQGVGDLRVPSFSEARQYDAFQNYVIRTKDRDSLLTHLDHNDVGTLVSWPTPTHRHPSLGLSHFEIPNTESISAEVVSLPMHPALEDDEIDYVVTAIREHYG